MITPSVNNVTTPSDSQDSLELSIPLMQYVERSGGSFFHYKGSLTTPNCTEGVNFLVLAEVQYISFDDMANFKRFWKNNKAFATYSGNNRLVQPLNGRPVYYKEVTIEEEYA